MENTCKFYIHKEREMRKEWKYYQFLDHFQQEADHDLDNDHHLVDFREEKQGQMESFRNFQQIHLEKGADATIHLLLWWAVQLRVLVLVNLNDL